MNKEITLEQLASYETAFDGDRANRIAMDAATKNGVNNAAIRFRGNARNAPYVQHFFGAGRHHESEAERPLLDVRGA